MYDVKAKEIFDDFACLNFPDNKIPDFFEPAILINKKYLFLKETINSKNKSSKYLGVSFRANRNKYRAYISINNKVINLGHFYNEIDAAKAYNKKVIELGLDRKLNKI